LTSTSRGGASGEALTARSRAWPSWASAGATPAMAIGSASATTIRIQRFIGYLPRVPGVVGPALMAVRNLGLAGRRSNRRARRAAATPL